MPSTPTRLTYKGMMLEGVPNMAVAIGYTNASWTLKCDLTCDYVCRLLNHMHEHGLTECVPDNQAAAGSEPILAVGLHPALGPSPPRGRHPSARATCIPKKGAIDDSLEGRTRATCSTDAGRT